MIPPIREKGGQAGNYFSEVVLHLALVVIDHFLAPLDGLADVPDAFQGLLVNVDEADDLILVLDVIGV